MKIEAYISIEGRPDRTEILEVPDAALESASNDIHRTTIIESVVEEWVGQNVEWDWRQVPG